jgi:ABC-type transporter Mla subunit MlaD
MAEFEFGGMTFKGGKMMIVLTALSTLGGTLWGGFEFYKDYMDMKEIIQNIDTTSIENRNKIIEQKLDDALLRIDEAVDYSRSIKNDLRDDFNRMEQNVDRVEDNNRELETKVGEMIDRAAERFDAKRDSLASDNRLAMDALESRLNKKLQQALDNPLAN